LTPYRDNVKPGRRLLLLLVFGGSVLFGIGVPLVLAVAMPRVISGCFTVAPRPAVQWVEDKLLTEMVKLYSHSIDRGV
jgi:hypothetical protein